MQKERTIDTLTVESSALCCNFVNTVYAWRGVNLNEYLKTYDDFVAWCRKLIVCDAAYLDELSAQAKLHPQKAEAALNEIKEVRQLFYNFISAIAAGEKDTYESLLKELNPLLNKSLTKQEIVYKNGTFQPELQLQTTALDGPLYVVLKSLYDLLMQADLNRIKECPKCGWVFLDETKNGRRRWCSPTECGTQDKMLRYNQKKRQISSE